MLEPVVFKFEWLVKPNYRYINRKFPSATDFSKLAGQLVTSTAHFTWMRMLPA